MHAVLPSLCSGCELCVAPCPVDCIDLVAVGARLDGRRCHRGPHAAQGAQRAARARNEAPGFAQAHPSGAPCRLENRRRGAERCDCRGAGSCALRDATSRPRERRGVRYGAARSMLAAVLMLATSSHAMSAAEADYLRNPRCSLGFRRSPRNRPSASRRARDAMRRARAKRSRSRRRSRARTVCSGASTKPTRCSTASSPLLRACRRACACAICSSAGACAIPPASRRAPCRCSTQR